MQVVEKKLDISTNKVVVDKMEKFILSKVPNYEDLSGADKSKIIRNLEQGCKSCELGVRARTNIPAILNPEAPFCFIGRSVCEQEVRDNNYFPKGTRHGAMWETYLRALNIGESEYSLLNMCYCYSKYPPTSSVVNKCNAFKHFELDIIGDNVKVFFPMCQDAVRWLLGPNHPGSIACHGDIYIADFKGRKVLVVPLLHPYHVMQDEKLKVEEEAWLKVLSKVIRPGGENESNKD